VAPKPGAGFQNKPGVKDAPSRCLIPRCGGTVEQQALRDALLARFYTAALGRLRYSVERYSGVKKA
jgi:hypothetical protein